MLSEVQRVFAESTDGELDIHGYQQFEPTFIGIWKQCEGEYLRVSIEKLCAVFTWLEACYICRKPCKYTSQNIQRRYQGSTARIEGFEKEGQRDALVGRQSCRCNGAGLLKQH
jgi:hypothetical protein